MKGLLVMTCAFFLVGGLRQDTFDVPEVGGGAAHGLFSGGGGGVGDDFQRDAGPRVFVTDEDGVRRELLDLGGHFGADGDVLHRTENLLFVRGRDTQDMLEIVGRCFCRTFGAGRFLLLGWCDRFLCCTGRFRCWNESGETGVPSPL